MQGEDDRDKPLAEAALDYHRYPTPGKLEISATKNMVNQRDLALAYSPGVAAACSAIEENPLEAASLTAMARPSWWRQPCAMVFACRASN